MEAELRLVFVAAAGSLLHEEAGELSVESLGDIHFRTAVKRGSVEGRIPARTQTELVAKHDGIHL